MLVANPGNLLFTPVKPTDEIIMKSSYFLQLHSKLVLNTHPLTLVFASPVGKRKWYD